MHGVRILAAVALSAALLAPGTVGAGEHIILEVDDGNFFYDSTGDCVGDTNDHTEGTALRHWHAGLPFAPREAEVAGGYGCGPLEDWQPQRWQVMVPATFQARVQGRIRYTWDQDVPGGGGNDVHLAVLDSLGRIVTHTVLMNGPRPVIPNVTTLDREHEFNFLLGAGLWTLEEDVFSGSHTAWLTRLRVELEEVPQPPPY